MSFGWRLLVAILLGLIFNSFWVGLGVYFLLWFLFDEKPPSQRNQRKPDDWWNG